MANASLFSPANSHFIQPLLSGSDSRLNIPVKFFSEHIEGKHEGKTVALRSDASEKTWKVTMEGQRLTEGWKEFFVAHGLRVSDFVVFRHEGDMLFHVTALGPSCCEIQYAPSGSRDEDEEENDESESSDEEVKKNLPTVKSNQSSSDLTCFSQYVTASNMSRDTAGVPSAFAKRNGLYEENQNIVLMNEEGRSWPSELKRLVSCRIVICRGWTSFCIANKLQVGDSCTFKLLQNAKTPVFQLCSRTKAERKKKTLSEEDSIAERTDENRFVKLTPTLNSLERGKQHLPLSFTEVNGLIKPEKIILVDKNGDEWLMELKVDNRSGLMCIMGGNGWKSFCAVNEVGAGEPLTLELIRRGASLLLMFCSKMEQSPFEAKARVHKRARVQKWIQETGPKLEIREKTAEEGEPSHHTRAFKKTIANQGNLHETLPCSIPNQMMTKVKHSVLCILTSIRRFREELETMEQKLEDSLQDIDNLCKMCNLICSYNLSLVLVLALRSIF